ncbi:uncharacterized protein LOC126808527 [Patella vulgata]|uniref:uncharacterized protein LOC126808527 n=1 Tax=Patella vulgata TaxID=6465 RepID=UPI00217F7C6E|nr:uncharacterized protein LOC126808527 [Patella vulgata]
MAMDLYTGARVKISLNDNNVLLGFINTINTNETDSVLVLDKVEIWLQGKSTSKTRLPGIQRVQASEIADIEILPETQQKTPKQNSKKEKHKNNNIKSVKRTPKHLRSLVELDPEKLIFGKNGPDVDEDLVRTAFKGDKSSDYDTGSDIEESYTADGLTVLTKIDDLFYQALRFISDKPVIGFAVEGVEIGRDGRLCWIQIDANGSIFLFDMIKLGEDGFDHGLKNIIQSEAILKVIHDCRMISDMLHHQYHIKMLNIFDTQVAHVFAYQAQNHKDLPRYVPGLASCLYEHLDLPNEQVHVMRIREQAKAEDQEIWATRPTPKWILDAASKHVRHLTELRIVLMEKMMIEFIAGVEIYLTYVRNASDKEATECQSKRHLLPLAFQHMGRFVKDLQRRMKLNTGKNNFPREKDQNGFREVSTRVIDPDVIASKDSPWHTNMEKTVYSNNKYAAANRDEKPEGTTHEKFKADTTCTSKIQNVQICDPNERELENRKNTSPRSLSILRSNIGVESSGTELSESDDRESVLSDTQFIQKISSQVCSKEKSLTPSRVFDSIRREENDSSRLKGITLIPAGLMQNNNPSSRKSNTSVELYSPSLFCSDKSSDDSRDYGEIPTPKTLGRAHTPVFSSPSAELSNSSSCDDSGSEVSNPCVFTTPSDRLKAETLEKTRMSETKRVSNFTPNDDNASHISLLPRQNLNSSETNVGQMRRHSSSSSENSSSGKPNTKRLHKLYELLNQNKIQGN